MVTALLLIVLLEKDRLEWSFLVSGYRAVSVRTAGLTVLQLVCLIDAGHRAEHPPHLGEADGSADFSAAGAPELAEGSSRLILDWLITAGCRTWACFTANLCDGVEHFTLCRWSGMPAA